MIANRLSENPAWQVLLLEAGPDEPEIVSNVPALAGYLQLSRIDWQYKSEPMPTACLGLTGGRLSRRDNFYESFILLDVFIFFPLQIKLAKRKSSGWLISTELHALCTWK